MRGWNRVLVGLAGGLQSRSASGVAVGVRSGVSSVDRTTPVTRRILVVDDDDLLREVAKAALEIVGGWHVVTAHSGAEARDPGAP